jgi:methyl-accepting chemotaxis protein
MASALSLRGRFALWTSAVIAISSLGLMLGVYAVSSHALRGQADEELERIVAKTTEELDLWISSRERDAVNLAELEALAAACAERNRAAAEPALVRIHQRSPFYENVFLADADGKLFTDSIGGKSVGVDLLSIEGFRPNVEHARRGEVWLGDAMRSPATGRPVALLTAPIRSGTRVVGILGTPIELSNFSESFLSKYRIRASGYLYMLDQAGVALAHPDASQIMSSYLGTTGFGREMLSRQEGALTYDYKGQSKTARFRRAHEVPWTIVATVPTSELLTSVRTIQLCLALFGLVTLGGAVGAVSYLAGKASRQVRRVATELADTVEEYFAAAHQISTASQSLAADASRQAASIEETSASAEEIGSITRQNAERSRKAAGLMNEAIPILNAVNQSHGELATSLAEMNASSEEVVKVIKMIDGIAFQTNILALNAAVEAARAGESGMGFAVVADEVRDLAQRSADAARETSTLIEKSLLKSRESREKLAGVLQAMEANTRISGAVKTETDGIREASEEQARGIAQIGAAIGQMNQVTQSTAANAEEGAAAATRLDGQSRQLKEIAERLTVIVSGASTRPGSARPGRSPR